MRSRCMRLTYTAQLLKEEDTYVAHAPKLDVSSCGDTPEEARRRLHEAVELFLGEAKRMGTLQSILEESGYSRKCAT